MKLNNKERILWISHPKYGQRIVDRRWPVNQWALSHGNEVWVVNPKKWTVASVNIADIIKVYGFAVVRVGGALLEAEYTSRIVELHSKAKAGAHAQHLQKQGIPPPTPSIIQHSGPVRDTQCWNCSAGLHSDDDMACAICKWLLCDCGACGCGYKFK